MVQLKAAERAHAGDRLREVVRAAAKRTFNPGYRTYDSNDNVVMGDGPGSNNFSTSELGRYCEDVVAAVNKELQTKLSWTRKAKISWTYRDTVNEIWADCFDQLSRATRAVQGLVQS